jgi:L-malate glycosyltransferase
LIRLFIFFKSQKIDIINGHLFIAGIISRLYGKLLRIPCILHTTHNIMYPRFEPIVNRMLEKYTDVIVVDSKAVKNKLIKVGQKAEKISVIYNGIDEKEFDQKCNPLKIRHQLDISKEDIVLGNIAGFQNYKGHDFLLEVFSKLIIGHKNIHLMLIGDGALKQHLELKAKELGVYDRVYFLGSRIDILPFVKAMDIMVHPSRWEGFGIILAEAMYCGIPVVASNSGGIPEVVEDGVCGFLHPFGDINAFVNSISLLIINKPLRLIFGANGRDHVRKKFTIKQMVENYLKLYLATLKGKGF